MAGLIRGFIYDAGVKRFCSMLIISAIQKARRQENQPPSHPPTMDQNISRDFLLAPENEKMITIFVDAMQINPDWFFSRFVKRLVLENWPPFIRPTPLHPPKKRKQP